MIICDKKEVPLKTFAAYTGKSIIDAKKYADSLMGASKVIDGNTFVFVKKHTDNENINNDSTPGRRIYKLDGKTLPFAKITKKLNISYYKLHNIIDGKKTVTINKHKIEVIHPISVESEFEVYLIEQRKHIESISVRDLAVLIGAKEQNLTASIKSINKRNYAVTGGAIIYK